MLMPLIAAVAVFVLGFLTAWRVSAALDYGFRGWALVIVGALVIAAVSAAAVYRPTARSN